MPNGIFQLTHNTSAYAATEKMSVFLIYGRELQPPKNWRSEVEKYQEKLNKSARKARIHIKEDSLENDKLRRLIEKIEKIRDAHKKVKKKLE